MKREVLLVLALACAAPALALAQDSQELNPNEQPPPPPGVNTDDPADLDPSAVDQYREQLEPYGQWVDVPDYGQAWQPQVDESFVPYESDGGWDYENGAWNFSSAYAWGVTCFHYGRWFNVPGYGWVWAPGRRWASAWVDWRNGGGYIGFAPRAPSRWSHPSNVARWHFTPQKQFMASAGHFHPNPMSAPPPRHGNAGVHPAPSHPAAPPPPSNHGGAASHTPAPAPSRGHP